MGNTIEEMKSMAQNSNNCTVHKSDPIQYCCVTCQTLFCEKCYNDQYVNHKSHNMQTFSICKSQAISHLNDAKRKLQEVKESNIILSENSRFIKLASEIRGIMKKCERVVIGAMSGHPRELKDENNSKIEKYVEYLEMLNNQAQYVQMYKLSIQHQDKVILKPQNKDSSQRFVKDLRNCIELLIEKLVDLENIIKIQEKIHKTENYETSDNIFMKKSSQIISENPAVHQLFTKLGPYKYPPLIDDGVKRVLKENHIVENGGQYYGFWNEETGKRDGKGVMIFYDGSRYDGYWKNNQAHGKGRLIHSDGDCYEGDWANDKAQGKGTYAHGDGALYTGDWEMDKQEGFGIETWPDGARYEGKYKNGKKEGKGLFKWSDGSEYYGDFVDNNIEGKGNYKWSDGREYEGEWVKNKMHGEGRFAWKDGRIYRGHYTEDKKEGYGVMEWSDGRKYEGEWKNGKQNGKGKYTNGKGKIIEGIWQDGKHVNDEKDFNNKKES